MGKNSAENRKKEVCCKHVDNEKKKCWKNGVFCDSFFCVTREASFFIKGLPTNYQLVLMYYSLFLPTSCRVLAVS